MGLFNAGQREMTADGKLFSAKKVQGQNQEVCTSRRGMQRAGTRNDLKPGVGAGDGKTTSRQRQTRREQNGYYSKR